MAVLALQAESLHVVLVAEWNRLVRANSLVGHPWRTLQVVQRDTHSDQDHSEENQAEPGKRIRTAIKNLRHFTMTSLRVARLVPSLWMSRRFRRHRANLSLFEPKILLHEKSSIAARAAGIETGHDAGGKKLHEPENTITQ
jgi:hypothetical protein